ncbi:MAG: ABC transporter permease subunit [Candidatus Lokiarchaeota archaeon]|nr:ABC transporter permease subunit [Candidatus Lokiarchaeota archaeon]
MSLEKSMVVAKTDLKMALDVRYVKYSMVIAGGFGPVMAIIMVVGSLLLGIPELLSLMVLYASSMIGLFAIMPASLIAANALVGEKEQRTLEPLLCTPLTDKELLMGKVLSSLIPSMVMIIVGTFATMIAANVTLFLLEKPLMLIPDIAGLVLIFGAGPPMVLAVIAVMILISGKVTRVYEAYQASGSVILVFLIPMFLPLASMQNEILDPNAVWLSVLLTVLLGIALMTITWLIAFSRFNRNNMVQLV